MIPIISLRQTPIIASLAVLLLAAFADAAPARDGTKAKPTPARSRTTSHAHPAKGLSTGANATERAAEIYGRGSFAMQVGQNEEAIAAFEQALKLAPDFAEAWGRLAVLYLKEGKSAKAVEAFRKAKLLGDANGRTVTRDGSGGLQFP
ncbi:MAG: tetratricopeptide repeat protein [Chthoniobacteraceae bacterium]